MRRSGPWRITAFVILSLLFCSVLSLAGPVTIGGSSMEPTLKNGQKVWVSNYPGKTNPERGDIVAFKDEKLVNVKRVIGLPGEKVIIREGSVYIANQAETQGKKLDEPYLAPGTATGPDGEYAVPAGRYFVLGDNRGHSRDSRQIGCIPRESIMGRVTKVF